MSDEEWTIDKRLKRTLNEMIGPKERGVHEMYIQRSQRQTRNVYSDLQEIMNSMKTSQEMQQTNPETPTNTYKKRMEREMVSIKEQATEEIQYATNDQWKAISELHQTKKENSRLQAELKRYKKENSRSEDFKKENTRIQAELEIYKKENSRLQNIHVESSKYQMELDTSPDADTPLINQENPFTIAALEHNNAYLKAELEKTKGDIERIKNEMQSANSSIEMGLKRIRDEQSQLETTKSAMEKEMQRIRDEHSQLETTKLAMEKEIQRIRDEQSQLERTKSAMEKEQ